MEPRPERARAPRGSHETPTTPVNTLPDRTSRVRHDPATCVTCGGTRRYDPDLRSRAERLALTYGRRIIDMRESA